MDTEVATDPILVKESEVIDNSLQRESELIRSKITDLDKRLREEEAKKNSAAEEGDLSENAGYQTAMENLARMNVEMRNLTAKERAFKQFSTEYEPSGYIGLHTTVRLRNDKERIELIIKLVPSDLGDASIRAVSEKSPVGQALMGKKKGDIIYVSTSAKEITYSVVDIY